MADAYDAKKVAAVYEGDKYERVYPDEELAKTEGRVHCADIKVARMSFTLNGWSGAKTLTAAFTASALAVAATQF